MLNFDNRGNLKPYSSIPSSINEMMKYFVGDIKSETRKANFDKYIRYSADLKKHAGGFDLKQWVDGSFVTKKANPKDIDVVTFLNQKQIEKLGLFINDYKMEGAYNLYGIDAYIIEVYEPKNKYHSYTIGDTAYWHTLFATTRKNRAGKEYKKGFLDIIY